MRNPSSGPIRKRGSTLVSPLVTLLAGAGVLIILGAVLLLRRRQEV